MKRSLISVFAGVAALSAVAAVPPQAQADAVADFYKGKTVTIYVSVAPGGLYSTFGQLLSKHFGRHIPGQPNVIVKHMTGAGGMRANNYVYNVALKDGTAVITPVSGLTKSVALKSANTKYDPRKYNWLGGWGEAVTDCTVWKTAPATTIEQARKTEVIIGAFSKSSTTYQRPALINTMLGTKIKIVIGYKGGSKVRLAMEKGEVHGFCGQFAGWKSRKPEWLKAGKLAHLVQFASKRSADMPNTRLFSEFAKTKEEREIFTFFQSGVEDRAMLAPPGVPADRLAALEKAYMATLRDPVFVAAAKKIRFGINPISSADIRKFVDGTMKMKPATIAKLRKALGLEK